jgi:exopolysaccharide biosynthesis predicted pyruvyltransferase EpsI
MQPARIASFETLLRNDYTVVGMPQSLYYRDGSRALDDARRLRESVAGGLGVDASALGGDAETREGELSRLRVRLCWREAESYDQAKELYPFASHLLVPDIAFQLGPYDPPPVDDEVPRLDVLLLLRGDHESTQREFRSKAAVRRELSRVSPGAGRLSFRIVDWEDRLELFQSKNIFFSDTSIRLLAMGRVVVCDRLHAAILCYLSNIPFVYLDQVSGKIAKTLAVALGEATSALAGGGVDCLDGDAARWARADNFTDALHKAVQFLDKYQLRP